MIRIEQKITHYESQIDGKPEWSQWGFQPSHIDFIQLQETKEPDNLKDDPAQRFDIFKDNDELALSKKLSVISNIVRNLTRIM